MSQFDTNVYLSIYHPADGQACCSKDIVLPFAPSVGMSMGFSKDDSLGVAMVCKRVHWDTDTAEFHIELQFKAKRHHAPVSEQDWLDMIRCLCLQKFNISVYGDIGESRDELDKILQLVSA